MDSTSLRIAFLDVDGTILTPDGRVAPSTVKAIRAARAAGCLVYLSTGRSAADLHPAVRAIEVDGAITNGGAYATSGGRQVVATPMPPASVERLVAYFAEHDLRYFVQTDEGVYASAELRTVVENLLRGRRGPGTSSVAPRYRELAEADPARIAKAVFLGDRPDVVERAQHDLGDAFHVVPGSMPLPFGSNGEVGLRGVTKGSAIEAVLRHLGLDPAEAIGVGDSWNDAEMFRVCGVSVAMGGADPELQRLAGEVTTSVFEDGVWNAFARHGLV